MKKEHHYKLKRELGLLPATLAGIGIIFGAGIYSLVGKAAGLAGPGVWISFLISALLAACTGLSYAEFSSMFPKAGAEYVFTKRAFGNVLAFLVGWMVIFSGVIGASTVALGFGGYFSALFEAPLLPSAIILLVILSLVNMWGVKQSAIMGGVLTLIETAGLLFIIAIALPFFGKTNYTDIPSVQGVFSAAALIFFAFIGFEEMVRLSEETKTPRKTIPKALILSIIITTVVYMFVSIAAVSVLSPAELSVSSSPLADVASKVMGFNSFVLMSVIALFSTTNTVLLMLLAASRITYGIAKDRCLPGRLSRINPKRRTPTYAILLVMVLSMLAVLIGDITIIANITNFTVYVTFIMVNSGVIVMRYKSPGKRPFTIPLSLGKLPLIPAIGALTSLLMMMSLGVEIVISGILLLVVGWIFYRIVNRKGWCDVEGRR